MRDETLYRRDVCYFGVKNYDPSFKDLYTVDGWQKSSDDEAKRCYEHAEEEELCQVVSLTKDKVSTYCKEVLLYSLLMTVRTANANTKHCDDAAS